MRGEARGVLGPRRGLDAAIALAAGAATSIAFPRNGMWPIAIIGPAVLCSLLRTASRRRGALVGFLYGVGFFGTLLSWTIDLGVLAWIGLVGSQAAFVAGFGVLVAGTAWADPSRRPSLAGVARLALAWGGIEILRGRVPLGGFTWGGLGYAFVDVPFVRDLAAIGGIHLISFVAVGLAGLLAREGGRGVAAARPARDRSGIGALAILAALLALAPLAPRPSVTSLAEVAVVQGNVPRERFTSALGRRGRVGPEDLVIVENHLAVSEALLEPDSFPPDLVVWPENAYDRDPDEYPNLAEPTQALIDAVDAPFIVGAIVSDDDGRDYNANLLWEPREGITDRYEKQHLVPFGEYVPGDWLRRVVPALGEQVPDDLDSGSGSSVLDAGGLAVGNAICFESSYPRDVRRAIGDGAEILLVSTNNATFGDSIAAELHLQTSRMRAIEHRISVVHAAISGITAFIDADGNARDRTGLFEPALVRRSVEVTQGRTLYAILGGPGEVAAAAIALVMLCAGFLPGRVRRLGPRRQPRPPIERVLVAIPTYDEADTIEATVRAVRAAVPSARVMILDDASPDGTGAIADRLAASDSQIEVVHRPGKQGLGNAYKDAFARALAAGVDAVVEMDADGSHDPAELPRLLGAAVNADLVIGSRYVAGGRIEGWSLARQWLSRPANRYARLWLGVPARDVTSGYRVYRRRLLASMRFDEIGSQGYAFQVEMTLRSAQLGATIAEVPITFRERRAGASKMSRRIVVEAALGIPRLALRRPWPRQEIDPTRPASP